MLGNEKTLKVKCLNLLPSSNYTIKLADECNLDSINSTIISKTIATKKFDCTRNSPLGESIDINCTSLCPECSIYFLLHNINAKKNITYQVENVFNVFLNANLSNFISCNEYELFGFLTNNQSLDSLEIKLFDKWETVPSLDSDDYSMTINFPLIRPDRSPEIAISLKNKWTTCKSFYLSYRIFLKSHCDNEIKLNEAKSQMALRTLIFSRVLDLSLSFDEDQINRTLFRNESIKNGARYDVQLDLIKNNTDTLFIFSSNISLFSGYIQFCL